ncbi:hypothetical protein BLS_000857 [Venturia inaequalis]|uniref:SGNH hydrolase-type esterase domain-containing protein n=1 Tax=Venturia inaequalis TaxID=5025 RepID=A0A8H3YJK5_VENIN|nr:hypothetical protein BLS_000857 [Venturia inaequalis]KAE9986458.1 hypothetical protein EG328_005684 [Venturia inaequalis]
MVHATTLLTLLVACASSLVTALPEPERESKTPFFILVGDSTTAPIQPWKASTPPGGGGWGDGFLKTLDSGVSGINLGKNGQTTVSYRANGHWKLVLEEIRARIGKNDKPDKGISLAQYQANLEKMVEELKALKANVFLITPLTRRSFNNGVITNNLDDQAAKSKAAAAATKVPVIDLNGASKKYVQAIGKSEAIKLDADYRDAKDASTTKDFTHLNAKASGLFGRMVADLLYGQVPEIGHWIKSDRALSAAIAAGKPVV